MAITRSSPLSVGVNLFLRVVAGHDSPGEFVTRVGGYPCTVDCRQSTDSMSILHIQGGNERIQHIIGTMCFQQPLVRTGCSGSSHVPGPASPEQADAA